MYQIAAAAVERGKENANDSTRPLPETWRKPRPESGLDWLIYSEWLGSVYSKAATFSVGAAHNHGIRYAEKRWGNLLLLYHFPA